MAAAMQRRILLWFIPFEAMATSPLIGAPNFARDTPAHTAWRASICTRNERRRLSTSRISAANECRPRLGRDEFAV